MPRLPADVTINITHHESGLKAKLELCAGHSPKHWVCRFNRKNSRFHRVVTWTIFLQLFGTLLKTFLFHPEKYAAYLDKQQQYAKGEERKLAA